MDEDIIEAIADALREQLESCTTFPQGRYYREATLDDIVAMAIVISQFQPTYDLRYFYKRAGYPEPYPYHPMEK